MTIIINGTDGLSDVDGSAATPAIRGTDANTGIFFPAADTVGVSTGGSERMRVDSSGNVGIGTSSPQTRLHAFSSATTTTVSIQGSLSAGANTPTLDFTGNNGGYSFGARIQAIRDTSAGGYALAFGTTTNNAAEGSAPTERMRIDSSGNVGIGTSSPLAKLQTNSTDGTIAIFRTTSGANNSRLNIDISDSAATAGFAVGGASTFPALTFANGGSERMRIDSSGYLLINQTSNVTSSYLQIKGAQPAISCESTSTGSVSQVLFRNPNGQVGSIGTSGSSTSYNTSSDYRLKQDIVPMTGALATVAQLKPVTYKWKVDGSGGQGFIAHELQEVCPDAVTGSKDAVDENGKPEYQGIDTSFLVATLTAAIQEQQALITSLTARVAALEGTQP